MALAWHHVWVLSMRSEEGGRTDDAKRCCVGEAASCACRAAKQQQLPWGAGPGWGWVRGAGRPRSYPTHPTPHHPLVWCGRAPIAMHVASSNGTGWGKTLQGCTWACHDAMRMGTRPASGTQQQACMHDVGSWRKKALALRRPRRASPSSMKLKIGLVCRRASPSMKFKIGLVCRW